MDAHIKKVYVPMTETGFYILLCLRSPNHGYGIVQKVKEITLKYGLASFINNNPTKEMNCRENTIIAIVMKLIAEDKRGYTSAKYLSEHLTDLGFLKTKQSILPYIELMKTLDILKDTDNPRKPYRIMKSENEISLLARNYLPDLSAEMTAKQISDDYLHSSVADRWHATDGF